MNVYSFVSILSWDKRINVHSYATFELVDKNNWELLTLQTETNFTIFHLIIVRLLIRAVIKSQGPGISPATMNMAPGHFHRKIAET